MLGFFKIKLIEIKIKIKNGIERDQLREQRLG